VFENAGDELPDKPAGHVIFSIRTATHARMQRDANARDLRMDLHISLKEALVGFSHQILHLDGHEVIISRNGITQPYYLHKVIGEGMPIHNSGSEFGDLYVRCMVDFPRTFTEDAKQKLGTVFDAA